MGLSWVPWGCAEERAARTRPGRFVWCWDSGGLRLGTLCQGGLRLSLPLVVDSMGWPLGAGHCDAAHQSAWHLAAWHHGLRHTLVHANLRLLRTRSLRVGVTIGLAPVVLKG